VEGILDYCIQAGVYGILCFGIGLTLRQGNREYFYEKLDRYFPGLHEQYHRKYGFAYEIASDNNAELMKLVRERCREHHIVCDVNALFAYFHEFPENKGYEQLCLF